jgi:hypothetical protein
MIYCVRVKPGVLFTRIMPDGEIRNLAPGGIALLSAIDLTAKEIEHDLTVTSALDGTHSGPNDPHLRGDALDIRTKDLPNPQHALETLKDQLGPLFFAWIENADGDNAHIHCQVRKNTVYPPLVTTDPIVTA